MRWSAGKASLLIGLVLALFAAEIFFLPQNGCGPPVIEAFRDKIATPPHASGIIGKYHCRSIAHSALPVATVVSLLSVWFVVVPSRRERERV